MAVKQSVAISINARFRRPLLKLLLFLMSYSIGSQLIISFWFSLLLLSLFEAYRLHLSEVSRFLSSSIKATFFPQDSHPHSTNFVASNNSVIGSVEMRAQAGSCARVPILWQRR